MIKFLKNNIWRILLIVGLIIFFMIIFYVYIRRDQVLADVRSIVYENQVFEINSEVYNMSLLRFDKQTLLPENNGYEILNNQELINTSALGNYKYTFNVKIKNEEIALVVDYKIVDTIAPEITLIKDEVRITIGEEVELLSNIKDIYDNSGEEIIPTVEGEYDFNTEGIYKLQYVASDSSENISKKDFTLKVEAKKEIILNNSNKDNNNNTNDSSNNNDVYNKEVTFTTSKGFQGVIKDGVTYIDGYLIANKTYSLPKDYVPTNIYSGKATSTSTTQCATCIEKVAYNNWLQMQTDAKKDGLKLWIQSGYRSYTLQNNLYNNYVKRSGKEAADTFSARPGYSEHQTGLAFDINNPSSSFNNTVEAKWLSENAYKYGYILRYPEGKSNETGYKYESWHFRYVGVDLATKLYNNGDWITLEEYFGITSEYMN